MSDAVEAAPARERARPLPTDERRSAIISAVIPLVKERGRDVSTRQIAEACGIAEGTIFRVFPDKDSLVEAAIDAYFDPEPLRHALRGIDPDRPVDEKIREVLIVLSDRMAGVVGFVSALARRGERPSGPPPVQDRDWVRILDAVFAPNVHELAVPVDTLAHYLRLLALASAMPPLGHGHRFTLDELLTLATHGVLAAPSKEARCSVVCCCASCAPTGGCSSRSCCSRPASRSPRCSCPASTPTSSTTASRPATPATSCASAR